MEIKSLLSLIKRLLNKLKLKKKINQKYQNYYHNSKILNKILNNKKFYRVNGASIDSRDVIKNNIFLALKGKKRWHRLHFKST